MKAIATRGYVLLVVRILLLQVPVQSVVLMSNSILKWLEFDHDIN